MIIPHVVILLIATLLTIAGQSIRAAMANTSKSPEGSVREISLLTLFLYQLVMISKN